MHKHMASMCDHDRSYYSWVLLYVSSRGSSHYMLCDDWLIHLCLHCAGPTRSAPVRMYLIVVMHEQPSGMCESSCRAHCLTESLCHDMCSISTSCRSLDQAPGLILKPQSNHPHSNLPTVKGAFSELCLLSTTIVLQRVLQLQPPLTPCLSTVVVVAQPSPPTW